MSRVVPLPKIIVKDKPHVVIRASAGSGKTYQLSNRYLDLLNHGASPQQILATTFTRKAAGEILERVLRRLAEAASDAAHAKKLGEDWHDAAFDQPKAGRLLADLCRSLHHVNISTIDSFFNRIANCFSHELGLPPQPQIVAEDDALAVRLRAEAIEAVLGDDDTQTLVDLLRRLHHDAAQRRITDAIDDIVKGLYNTYRETKEENWNALVTPPTLDDAQLTEAIALLETLADDAEHKTFARAIHAARENALAGDWAAFLGKGLAAKIIEDPVSPVFNRKPVPAPAIAVYSTLIEHARGVLLGNVAAQTRATYDLLRRFDVHYTRLRLAQRVLLFSDLPHKLARELPLSDDGLLTEIHYRLDAVVRHLLLDEFQDTSFEQWKVLRPFAEEITRQCTDFRTFFCVGDVKQAIYAWRGGRAELFDRIESDLELSADARVAMNVSFRSSQVVLDAVGKVFTNLGDNRGWKDDYGEVEQAAQWAAQFEEHVAKKDLPGYVELITSTAGPATQDDAGDTAWRTEEDDEEESTAAPGHVEFVARRIAEWNAKAPGRSIGVLVARNAVVQQIVFALRRLGVDASAEGAGSLTGDPAVDVILSALRLADHPGHTAAAFHVLNSPLGAVLNLRSIHAHDCAPVSETIRRALLSDGYATVLTSWARAIAPWCDVRSGQRLAQLVDLADDVEKDLTLRTRDFVQYIETVSVQTPASTPVRVMTVHRAKGLEFDIVVLPELGKKAGFVRNDATCVDRDDATDAIRAVYRATNKATRALSPALEEAYRQERARRLRDDLCGLYVAMTRAKQALHMIVEPVKLKKNGEPSTKGVSDQSYAALLRGALTEPDAKESDAGGECLYVHDHSDANWHAKLKDAGSDAAADKTEKPPASDAAWKITLATSERPSRRTLRQVAPSGLHQSSRVNVADLLALQVDQGRQHGTLMHAWFEAIEWLDAGAKPDDDALGRIAAKVCGAGVEAAWVDAKIKQFRAMLAKPGVRAALSQPTLAADESIALWRERAFTVRRGGDLMRGVFDRVIVIEAGGRTVRAELIDFKTDRVEPNEANIPRIVEQYRPQMEAYRDALAAMLALDARKVTCSLLLLACGKRIEV
ncbi:MAG: UvrD-helicase domain-containing protein [Phycisphaeraceae bacterium]